jgi:predicted alpha/beta-hydrolase family hydrolase
MKHVAVKIEVETGDKVSAVISVPENHVPGKGVGVIIAHGAQNDMENPLITAVVTGLAKEGFLSLRFNFPYKEQGRKSPDSPGKLIKAWLSVYAFLEGHKKYAVDKIITAGKSMGGRVVSQMAADRLISPDGLIFLGYPLHPPGQKEKKRADHLYTIKVPMLFFAGTRDALCDLDTIKGVMKKIKVKKELVVVEGGDHSFKIPKSMGRNEEEVYAGITEKCVEWLRVI